MDQGSQEILQEILRTPLHELTEDQKRFIHARRDYLTRSQKEDFAEVINEVAEMNERKVAEEKGEEVRIAEKAKKAQPVKKPQAPRVVAPEVQEPQAPESTLEVAPEVQDQDVRLELDQPSESEGEGSVEVSQQIEELSAEDCLDPDCTHENHTTQPNA